MRDSNPEVALSGPEEYEGGKKYEREKKIDLDFFFLTEKNVCYNEKKSRQSHPIFKSKK